MVLTGSGLGHRILESYLELGKASLFAKWLAWLQVWRQGRFLYREKFFPNFDFGKNGKKNVMYTYISTNKIPELLKYCHIGFMYLLTGIMVSWSWIFEHVSLKNKDMFLYHHRAIIIPKKLNDSFFIISAMYSLIKIPQLSKYVLCNWFFPCFLKGDLKFMKCICPMSFVSFKLELSQHLFNLHL